MTIVQRQQAAVAALQSLKSSIKLDSFAAYDPGRDGGTGRRSGLKIRRYLVPWGFDSPSRHQDSQGSYFDFDLDSDDAKNGRCA